MKNWNLLFWFMFLAGFSSQAQDLGKTIKIGIIADTDKTPLIVKFVEGLQSEIREVVGSSYEIKIKDENIRYSNWDLGQIKQHFQEMLGNDDVELIIGVGLLSSGEFARSGPFSKPVIASTILNPQLQQIPLTLSNTSGVKNMTYVLTPFSPVRDLEVFRSIYPFQKLGVIVRKEINSQTDVLNQQIDKIMVDLGLDYLIIPTGEDISEALNNIPQDVDAIYYAALFLEDDTRKKLFEEINNKKLPSFSLMGRDEVELGALAGIAPTFNLDKLIRRVAVNVQRLADGIPAEDLTVTLSSTESLVLNMETARKVNLSPTWNILQEAELLNEEREETGRLLTLQKAIEEALNVNWPLRVARKDVEVGEKLVRESKSPFFPQWEASAIARWIDQDRAESGFGSQPEGLGLLSTGVSQVVYSEQINAGYEIQKRSQDAIISGKDITELDVILETSKTYLNLLRLKTIEGIQKENLVLTRRNLELARVRQAVGYSGPSDLYRWQSEIALTKINLNNAQALRRNVAIGLNQILNRNLDEPFETTEVELTDPDLITNDPRLTRFINSPAVFARYTNFMVQEGMRNLPELKQIDALIEAQNRQRQFTKRNLYQPTIGIDAGLDYSFYRGGVGTEPPTAGFPVPNDVAWNVGVGASLPIFTGGKRTAQYQRASVEMEALEYERRNLVNQLEQRIRSNMELVGASFANIEQSQAAQEASLKNFELVQDSYSKGLVSIIQLIDAQNAYLDSKQVATNAVFTFVIDIMKVERSVGLFYSISSAGERDEYFDRLEEFMNAN